MAKQVHKCPTVIQRVHYKHGDTRLVQTPTAWPAISHGCVSFSV